MCLAMKTTETNKIEKLNSEADLILKVNEMEKEGLSVPQSMQGAIKKIYKSNNLKSKSQTFLRLSKMKARSC